jgi:hypothetical protein
VGIDGGANCQQYVYELLRHSGFVIPNFRSSNLWEDSEHTFVPNAPRLFDIVMLSKSNNYWGAHVGLYWGDNFILHLSKKNSFPAIQTLTELMELHQHTMLIGYKRCWNWH